VNISIATSFDWRHRLLDKINELPSDRMKDLREIKEIQIPYSAKGSRKPVSKALSKSKISVVFSGDRAGKLDSDYSFVSDRKSNKILERIRMNLNEHSIIVTNSKSIKRMFENRSFVCYSAKEEYSQDDIITKLVHDWDNWMIRFKGVATKYLHNYLHWFDYLNNSYRKSNQELSFINLLLRHS
jgi:transposase-like protein